jgi:hypothetical protein
MTISDFLQVDIVINVAQGNLFHNGIGLGEGGDFNHKSLIER